MYTELVNQKTEEVERIMNEKRTLIADVLQIPLHDYDTISEVSRQCHFAFLCNIHTCLCIYGGKQGRLLELPFSIHMHNYNRQFLQFWVGFHRFFLFCVL